MMRQVFCFALLLRGNADSSFHVPGGYATCSQYLIRFPRRKCDGVFDCGSKEDEQDCDCVTGVYDRSFQCKGTTKCIDERLKCDGTDNCENGSDEEDCGGCTFQCKNSTKCMDERLRCDGYNDCKDKSDEAECGGCSGIAGRSFKCGDTTKCIHDGLKCDGYDDCKDSVDETACDDCNQYVEKFPLRKCDGIQNCKDGADEKNCATCPTERPFKCGNTTECIPDSLVCNDVPGGCKDGSDEASCASSNLSVNCEWNEWSEWSSCAICASPMKERSRTVYMEAGFGGRRCSGDSTESRSCASNDCPIGCGGLLDGRSGSFSSRVGYYANVADCLWLVQGVAHEIVKLTFTHFDLLDDEECTYDYVALYDGDTTPSNLITEQRGRILDATTYMSGSHQMYIRLKTNGGTAPGFSANFTKIGMCVDPADTAGYNVPNDGTKFLTIESFHVPGVSCATGYSGNASAEKCSYAGGEYTLIGCAPLCVDPANTAGYNVPNDGTKVLTIESFHVPGVSCASGYLGNARAEKCSHAGGEYTLKGCEPACSGPANTTGYNLTAVHTKVLAVERFHIYGIKCATGYFGIAKAEKCNYAGEEYTLKGCLPNSRCPKANERLTYVSSKEVMVENGWTFTFSSDDMKNVNVRERCGNGKTWFGWSAHSNVGTLRATFSGSCTAVLRYRNCWDSGTVEVYINGAVIDKAPPGIDREIPIDFNDGDVLEIKDGGANSVILLRGLDFFTREYVWKTAYSCGESTSAMEPDSSVQRVRVCSIGSPVHCVESKTQTPLINLRTRGTLQSDTASCDLDCIKENWTGEVGLLKLLTYSCRPTNKWYHACNNQYGLDTRSNICSWHHIDRRPVAMQYWMRSPIPPCGDGWFSCDAKCIPIDWLCNGVFDCSDRSDEASCAKCPKGRPFRCGNTSKCIHESLQCDGVNDCDEGIDEVSCIQCIYSVDGSTPVHRTCLKSCPQVQDEETCVSSIDGRFGTKYAKEPCVWCCGDACDGNGNKCEPLKYLTLHGSKWNQKGKRVGHNTCQ